MTTLPCGCRATAAQKKSQNRFRNPNAIYFLPSENEWCKAAYYHPQANSGSGRYWTYARNLSKVGSTVTADITSNQGNVDGYVKFRRNSPRFFRLRAGTIRKKRGNLDDFEESTDFH